jgi:hypothetical protein
MQLNYLKAAILGGWVLGLGAIAVASNLYPASGWMLLVGLIPPLLLVRVWHQPPQTISENIREVLK